MRNSRVYPQKQRQDAASMSENKKKFKKIII